MFGLSELGNIHARTPRNSDLNLAIGGHNVTFVQMYTSIIKSTDEKEPLMLRPHLLTYLLGREYVSKRPKFLSVWKEVDTQKTKLEILEMCHPNVPFDARFEVVITEDDPQFLADFRHHQLLKLLVTDALLVRVSAFYSRGFVKRLISFFLTYRSLLSNFQDMLATW